MLLTEGLPQIYLPAAGGGGGGGGWGQGPAPRHCVDSVQQWVMGKRRGFLVSGRCFQLLFAGKQKLTENRWPDSGKTRAGSVFLSKRRRLFPTKSPGSEVAFKNPRNGGRPGLWEGADSAPTPPVLSPRTMCGSQSLSQSVLLAKPSRPGRPAEGS